MEDGENGIQLSLGLSVVGKVRRKSLIDINSAPQEEDGENVDEGQACRLKCDTATSDRRDVQAEKRRQDAKRKREEKRLVGKDNANNNFSSAFDQEGEGLRVVPDLEFKRGRLETGFRSRVVLPGPTFLPFGNVGGFSDGSHCYGLGQGVSLEEANHNCNNGGSNNGSGGCSSSMISENKSISSQGGCSSDSGSYLSLSRSGKTELDTSSGSETQEPALSRQLQYASGVNQTSQTLQRTKGVDGAIGNKSERVIFSNTSVPCQVHLQEEDAAGSLPIARMNKPSIPRVAAEKINKPLSDMGKPPKPLTHNHSIPALSHMPCVSTTGNGPNGKTITGFLYRYTKTEVSIVCVCHGKSFSPTEFVEHAGGVDILHPLKHITVVPSALR